MPAHLLNFSTPVACAKGFPLLVVMEFISLDYLKNVMTQIMQMEMVAPLAALLKVDLVVEL